jgi:hypothetical protein
MGLIRRQYMARIHELKINNFRGIKSLTVKFNNKKLYAY